MTCKVMRVVGTWGPCILKIIKNGPFCSHHYISLPGQHPYVRALKLSSGELRRAVSKTGVLIIARRYRIWPHAGSPNGRFSANFRLFAKITIFEDPKVGLSEHYITQDW